MNHPFAHLKDPSKASARPGLPSRSSVASQRIVSPEDLGKAVETAREIFVKDIANAKTKTDKLELAKQLRSESVSLDADPSKLSLLVRVRSCKWSG